MRIPRGPESKFDFGMIIERAFRKQMHVHGVPLRSDDFDTCHRWLQQRFLKARICPFCSCLLEIFGSHFCPYSGESESFIGVDGYDDQERKYSHVALLWSCPNCQYWQWYSGGKIEASNGEHQELLELTAAISKLRSFEPEWPDGCYDELTQHLRRNKGLWGQINPSALERLVAAVYRANYHLCEVLHVGQSNDGGVDVVFVDSETRQWLIQVKRRANSRHGEGVSTVRNLLGAMIVNHTLRGVVVSTADHFTFQALRAVHRAGEAGMHIDLVDLGKLNRMVGGVLPRYPYLPFIEYVFPELADQFVQRVIQREHEPCQLTLF